MYTNNEVKGFKQTISGQEVLINKLREKLEEANVINPLMEFNSTLREAIRKWGEGFQIDMLHEEIGELLQAINKFKRINPGGTAIRVRDNLVEEIADVEIMLEQLKMIVNCKAGVITKKREKLQRLKERLSA